MATADVYLVTIQIDDVLPGDRRVRPNTVAFPTWSEAAAASDRALRDLPAGITTVMISLESPDQFGDDDPDLSDWPAPRHIITGPLTDEDF